MARTVLIVDDHAPFRKMARRLLEMEGFEVVGEAADGVAAIQAAERLRPAIVLLDVQLPDIDGFAVAEAIGAEPSPPLVVLVSTRDASSYRHQLAQSHARGFIAKTELSGRSLAAAIE